MSGKIKHHISKNQLIKILKKYNYHIRKTAEYFKCSIVVISDRVNKYNIEWNKEKKRSENISIETKNKIFSEEHKNNISKALKGKKLSKETKVKISKAHILDFNKVSYCAKHNKIIKKYGKATFCELNKNHKSKRFDWANINNEYNENINEWIRLCKSCHIKFDRYKSINLEEIKIIINNRKLKKAA